MPPLSALIVLEEMTRVRSGALAAVSALPQTLTVDHSFINKPAGASGQEAADLSDSRSLCKIQIDRETDKQTERGRERQMGVKWKRMLDRHAWKIRLEEGLSGRGTRWRWRRSWAEGGWGGGVSTAPGV